MQSPGSVAFVILFARIAILDPALWIIVFNLLHFGRASNTFGNVLPEEQCNHHEVSLPPGHFQNDSLVLDCLSSFVHSVPPVEFFHFPKWIEIYTKFTCERKTLSSCTEQMCFPSFLVLLVLHQSVPE